MNVLHTMNARWRSRSVRSTVPVTVSMPVLREHYRFQRKVLKLSPQEARDATLAFVFSLQYGTYKVL